MAKNQLRTYALCEPNGIGERHQKKNNLKIIWKNIYNFYIKMNFDLIVATYENNGISSMKNYDPLVLRSRMNLSNKNFKIKMVSIFWIVINGFF